MEFESQHNSKITPQFQKVQIVSFLWNAFTFAHDIHFRFHCHFNLHYILMVYRSINRLYSLFESFTARAAHHLHVLQFQIAFPFSFVRVRVCVEKHSINVESMINWIGFCRKWMKTHEFWFCSVAKRNTFGIIKCGY